MRQKLDAKYERNVVIGYSKNSHGYRLYNPLTKKFSTKRDVFLEDSCWDWNNSKPSNTTHTFADSFPIEDPAFEPYVPSDESHPIEPTLSPTNNPIPTYMINDPSCSTSNQNDTTINTPTTIPNMAGPSKRVSRPPEGEGDEEDLKRENVEAQSRSAVRAAAPRRSPTHTSTSFFVDFLCFPPPALPISLTHTANEVGVSFDA
ncbi:hypothetical protein E3N88_21536 [Mikania micrantha]|uniref:Retroviral polymerase SH3-like domain-containing protein n=1 Tax=Mikania micrantha TaxID=192012 RepID=A0A5N6NLY3_9ASTR|nr:hypothetical protein E3N88_21536 [Mikania micrantha]